MNIEVFFTGSRVWFTVPILIGLIVGLLEQGRAWILSINNLQSTRKFGGESIPLDPESVFSRSNEYAPGSLIRQRVRDLNGRHMDGQEIVHADVADLTRARVEQTMQWSRYIAGAAVLIGFLGTLLGLSAAIEEVLPLLNEGALTTVELEQAVAGTLGGMQTAFYTTFAGVFTAVVLGLGATVVRRSHMRLLSELEELTSDILLPVFQTTEAAALARNAERLAEMQEHLDTGVRHLLDGFERKTEMLAVFVKDRVEAMVGGFQHTATSLVQQHESVAADMRSLIGVPEGDEVPSLAEQVSGVHEYVRGLDDVLARYRGLLKELEERIHASIDEQTREFTRTLGQHTVDMRSTIESQSSIFAQLGRSISELEETVGAHREALAEQSVLYGRQEESWAAALNGMESFSRAVQSDLAHMAELFDALSTSIPLELRDSLSEPIERLTESTRRLAEVGAMQSSQAAQIGDALNRNLESSEEVVVALGDHFTSATASFAEEVANLRIELSRWTGNGHPRGSREGPTLSPQPSPAPANRDHDPVSPAPRPTGVHEEGDLGGRLKRLFGFGREGHED